jgi:hypothetical protein
MTQEITPQQDTRTLAERLAARRIILSTGKCLLLDTSASMSIDIEPGQSRIDALREIVKAIHGDIPTFHFGSQCFKIDKNKIPDPSGYTAMHKAFEAAKAEGFKSVLLITDGEPDSEDAALNAANGLNIQIMYVGSGKKPEFLDKLAKACGNYCTVDDLKEPAKLTEKIQLYLSAGSEKPSEARGPICL